MKSKKDLKNEYKEMTAPMGVFQIKNITENKFLIDHSTDMCSKWNRHKMELKFGNHKNKALQADWNRLGENNFAFEILSELQSKNEENVDYQKELKVLHELTMQELNLGEDDIY